MGEKIHKKQIKELSNRVKGKRSPEQKRLSYASKNKSKRGEREYILDPSIIRNE